MGVHIRIGATISHSTVPVPITVPRPKPSRVSAPTPNIPRHWLKNRSPPHRTPVGIALPIWTRPKFAPRNATSAVTKSPIQVTSSGVKAFTTDANPATTRSPTAASLRRPPGKAGRSKRLPATTNAPKAATERLARAWRGEQTWAPWNVPQSTAWRSLIVTVIGL